MACPISSWAVYSSPLDFPGSYVARRFEGDQATNDFFVSKDLEEVRRWIQSNAAKCAAAQGEPIRFARAESDPPQIIECWL